MKSEKYGTVNVTTGKVAGSHSFRVCAVSIHKLSQDEVRAMICQYSEIDVIIGEFGYIIQKYFKHFEGGHSILFIYRNVILFFNQYTLNQF